MTDWIELMLGEDDEEEAEDEERPALDGAAEMRRPAPSGRDETEEEPDPDGRQEKLPEHRMEDRPPELPGGMDWAGLRTDGTDWAKWTAEAVPEAGRPEWTRMAEGPVREMGGRLEAGRGAAGAGSPGPVLKPDRKGSAALAELYRGAAAGTLAPAPALARSGKSRTSVEREAGGAPPLTVEELDRAVRRDSRRYDGGMNIF